MQERIVFKGLQILPVSVDIGSFYQCTLTRKFWKVGQFFLSQQKHVKKQAQIKRLVNSMVLSDEKQFLRRNIYQIFFESYLVFGIKDLVFGVPWKIIHRMNLWFGDSSGRKNLVKVKNKHYEMTALASFSCSYCWIRTYVRISYRALEFSL